MIDDPNSETLEVMFTTVNPGQGIRLAFHPVPVDDPSVDKDTGCWDLKSYALLSNPFSTTDELARRLSEIGLPEEIACAGLTSHKKYSVSRHQLTQIGFSFPIL